MGSHAPAEGTEAWWQKMMDLIMSKMAWREVILDPATAGVAARYHNWAKEVFDSKPYNFRPLDLRTDGYRYQARIDLFLQRIEPEDFGARARRCYQF